jgi:hypothetical protein
MFDSFNRFTTAIAVLQVPSWVLWVALLVLLLVQHWVVVPQGALQMPLVETRVRQRCTTR